MFVSVSDQGVCASDVRVLTYKKLQSVKSVTVKSIDFAQGWGAIVFQSSIFPEQEG